MRLFYRVARQRRFAADRDIGQFDLTVYKIENPGVLDQKVGRAESRGLIDGVGET